MTCSFGSVVKRGPSRSSEDVSPLRASKTCALAILITHLPDPYYGVLAARHAPTHPEFVVVGVNGDDLDVAHRCRPVAHLARHLLSLEDPARGSIEFGERASPGFVDPAGLGCPEADLYGRVAILLGGADRRDQVRLHFDYGYAYERAVILEGLGHVLFASEYCGRHNPTSPLSLCSRRRAGRAA